jgi:mRNA-degrading endonuclease toxin of MazEF toxin-antitoxin module
VANVSQVLTLDKSALTTRVGRLPAARLQEIISGVLIVLGR